ncbi:MAG: acyloxyacyl hydrolase [Bacteroidales bacterium]
MKKLAALAALLALSSSPALAEVDEIRLGLSLHDISFLGHGKEDGVDGVGEVLFQSPGLLEAIWAPRPHVGIAVNSAGDTSQLYAGLTWGYEPVERLFVEFSLGGAVHDGKLSGDALDRKQLGSRALFRESLALGWRFDEHNSLMVVFDHESNARLAEHNEGLNNLGIRWGYRF